MHNITIVDYGCNNILSLLRALEHYKVKVNITSSPKDIIKANKLILPGVGNFGESVANLERYGLVEPIKEYVKTGNLFLGICVGMQLMFQGSEESTAVKGLGIFNEMIRKIPSKNGDGQSIKVPNIGWHPLIKGKNWEKSVLDSCSPNEEVYFVHSYGLIEDNLNSIANVNYQGIILCAAIKKENCIGFQYHPEKSGQVGLRHLEKFIQLK